MELYLLRTFAAVAREGGITRAAAVLFLSQPAVSGQIKALEEELGLVLFERTPKGMRPTPAGRALLASAESLLDGQQALLDQAKLLKGEIAGEAALGTVGDPQLLQLGDFLGRLHARYPKITVRLEQSNSGTILNKVKNGQLTAGYVVGPAPGGAVQSLLLKQFWLYLAAPAGWREKVETASWEELLTLPWIWPAPQTFCHLAAQALCRQYGAEPPKAVEADQEQTTRSLLKAGVGLALMHEENAQAARAAGEVFLRDGARQSADLRFVYAARRARDPVISALTTVIHEVWAL